MDPAPMLAQNMYTFKVNVGTSVSNAKLHHVTLDIGPLMNDKDNDKTQLIALTQMLCGVLSIPIRKVKKYISVKL